MKEFEYVKKAFSEESSIKERATLIPWNDEGHINYTNEGISSHVTITENIVKLQFLGWELVLLKNGQYYINDTTG